MYTHQKNANMSHTRPSLHICALYQHHESTFTVMTKEKTKNFFQVCSLKKDIDQFQTNQSINQQEESGHF